MSSPALVAHKNLAYALSTLSVVQRLYVESRAHGSPPIVAARIAGSNNPGKAAKLYENDDMILIAIQQAVRVQNHEREFTRESVAEIFKDALNVATNAMEMVAAGRELGKLFGHYAPEVKEVTHTSKVLEQLTDTELLDIAAIDADYEILDLDPVDSPPGT